MSTSDAESWRPNVAAIILDEADNVLFGITSTGSRHVHFPQGGVGRGESMADAVLREVGEEVGLGPERLTILARFGGLRYRYRNKNRKSHIWDGQEQTYFLIRCDGIKPPVNLAGSDEFVSVRWLPWYTLEAGLFVSFKQPVMRQVLEHFFPRHLTSAALSGHLQHNCRLARYLSPAGYSAACGATGDRFLFAGGKEEAAAQFDDAALELLDLQRRAEKQGMRLLLIPLGLPGSGLRPCLRRLARCMDPLRTSIVAATPRHADATPSAWLLEAEPQPGQAVILLDNPYSYLLEHAAGMAPQCLAVQLAELREAEHQLERRGVRILRLFLNTSPDVALKRSRKAGSPIPLEAWQHLRYTADTLMEPADWYLLPSDCGWYRNLMAIRAVAEALGSC